MRSDRVKQQTFTIISIVLFFISAGCIAVGFRASEIPVMILLLSVPSGLLTAIIGLCKNETPRTLSWVAFLANLILLAASFIV